MTEIAPKTPYEIFKQRYAPLYRVLLVLGVIAAFLSLASLTNVRTIFGYFQSDPIYATSSLMTALIVPALMISSLILLWHKHPTGIRIRLIGYGVSIAASAIGLFTSPTTLERIAKEVTDAAIRNSNGVMTENLAASITQTSFYGALYISIGVSLLFAWLWLKAWKRQMKVDTKKQST